MVNKKRISERLQRVKEEENTIKKQKEAFLECILQTAKPEFENYEKGYKVFSIIHSHRHYFSLDDDMITNIVNNLTESYKCKLNSLAVSQPPLSPKEYTLTFEK